MSALASRSGELVDLEVFREKRAASKEKCRETLLLNASSVADLTQEMGRISNGPVRFVIVVAHTRDMRGMYMACRIFPEDRQKHLNREGEPFVSRLCGRSAMQSLMEQADHDTAEKLRGIDGPAVLVVDHDVFEVFPVSDAYQ